MNTTRTFGEKVIHFNQHLQYRGSLPKGFSVLNPYPDNLETIKVMSAFYGKYYNDYGRRKLILGINPSRNCAGITGVPFTDTKRLESVCGIKMYSAHTHEISSVFMYDMIEAYGGAHDFYQEYYINSPFPLAIVRRTPTGQWLNANYYDDKTLFAMTKAFMIESIKGHIHMGIDTTKVFVLGKKNASFIAALNKEANLFGKLTVLEHPRYIQQYQSRKKQLYIDKYLLHLKSKE